MEGRLLESGAEKNGMGAATYGSVAPASDEEEVDFEAVRDTGVRASNSFFDFIPRSASMQSVQKAWKGLRGTAGKIDWLSMIVVYWVTLVSEAARGLVLPSQWPFLESVGGSRGMLGIVVASFSFGRMISTVPLGFLSDKISMKMVLIICSMIQVFGHFIYSLSVNKFVILTARIIVGFGSATMSVCRAHITRCIPKEHRTYHFAYLSALQFVGFAVLPGAGGLLAALPKYSTLEGLIHFNQYSDPGWVLMIANCTAIFMLLTVYHDPPTQRGRGASSRPSARPSQRGRDVEGDYSAQPDVLALTTCVIINVAFRGVVAQLETVAAPFLIEKFDLSLADASYLISCLGFAGLIIYLSFKPISKRFSDRALVTFGAVMAVTGSLILFAAHNFIGLGMWTVSLGLIWSVAYPIGQTAILGLFSKTLAGLPAGGFLGMFSAAGSLSRLLFATMAGYTWSVLGRAAVFFEMTFYMSVTLVLTLSVYGRLGGPTKS